MTIYLYKKTHNKTGLQYLGKTTAKDPHKYKGSGTYWRSHINVHGYNVTTEILKECQTPEEIAKNRPRTPCVVCNTMLQAQHMGRHMKKYHQTTTL